MNSSFTNRIFRSSRIGFDLGNTVLTAGLDRIKRPFPYAFDVLARCVREAGHVSVISRVSPEQERRARIWIPEHRFCEQTGIAFEDIHFCAERCEKSGIAQRLGLTHFVDDRPEVLAHMDGIVPHRLLFQGDATDYEAHKSRLADVCRVDSWKEIEMILFP